MQQEIRYCTAPDGVRLAYALLGKGPPIVRAPHWFTHLDHDLNSPIQRHFVLGLAHGHRLLRYDARGNGLSQRDNVDVSFERWVSDLETVVDAAGFERFPLVGISQAASISIAYAARHPERVSHLIIYCGYARGLLQRNEDPDKLKQKLDLACALVRDGWGSNEESHRQFFTSQFIPGASVEQQHALNELARASATPEMAQRFLIETANVNVVDMLAKVKAPTLVMHVRNDLRVPFELGQEIAAGIPGAKFVTLEGRNHMLLPNEPAHRQFHNAVATFLGEKPVRGALPGTATISERVEDAVGSVERNWFIKIVVIFAAIAGCILFFWELWKAAAHGG